MAAAAAGGPAVSLAQMAVGDGNGNPVTPPTGSETAMVRERYRTSINSLVINPTDATQVIVEMLVPPSQGGWAVHEIGVFDSTGALFAYGNFPATYKPTAAEGSTRDMIVLAYLKVSNSADVELVIDASIVGATRQWVINTITPAYLFPGGTTGQVLSKKSNTNGDTEWKDPTAALNIVVDVIKEEQTAAASQTTYTMVTCTTDGVAVYVEGVRLHNFTVLNQTQLQIPTAYPAGTKVLFVQNEPNEPLNLRKMAAAKSYFMGQFV
jgi:phage-related tail fiber protein